MTITMIATSVFLLMQTARGSIEGIVINQVTSQPIADAQIAITKMPGPSVAGGATGFMVAGAAGGMVTVPGAVTTNGQFVRPLDIAPVTTDGTGRFALRDLDPGNYLLRASAEGYAREDFNARPGAASGISTQVNLSGGQAVKDVVFRLVPGGTVSGRITGSNGDALVNIEVSVLRSRYNPDGRKTFQQSGVAMTNDRGEYRLFWITPGRYYVSAASSTRPLPGIPFNAATARNKYPRTFYPATTDIATAMPIEVQPAVELSGLDFRLSAQPTYRIRGRVVDPSSADTPRLASISITPRDAVINTGFFSSGTPYNPMDGTFELRDVPSGSYLVRAQLPLNGRFEPGQPPPTPPTATALIDVAGADVDGLVLTLIPPTSIAGRIRVDGESLLQNFAASVNLRPAESPAFGPSPRSSRANAEGVFNIDGVVPGEYRVTANAQFGSSQMNLYVKEIRFGSTDVLNNVMVVTGPASDTLEVVLGKNSGQISGTVHGDAQQLVSSAQVVLIPDQRNRQDLYKFVLINPSGQFTFPSVPPGSYKVFAWENLEQFSWFDATVLSRYEAQGTPATVNESSKVTLDLKLIPGSAR